MSMLDRRRACLLLVSLLALGAIERVTATSYEAVSFNDLLAKADMIFVGDVLDVRPFAVGTRDGTVIMTRVTFVVRDRLWGTSSPLEILEFMGGELGDIGQKVAEMPTFKLGDRRVVFAKRERSINPIVGFTQGLMRITRDDAGLDVIQTSTGEPLARTEDIGRPRGTGVRESRPMALSSFRERIVDGLRERRR
ncbi:MAG: hypothetical protein Q7J25_00190 [Vicinamibacterales bacterium]|nr:hypothetical protein [Vicinamibacterales bacterium]